MISSPEIPTFQAVDLHKHEGGHAHNDIKVEDYTWKMVVIIAGEPM